MPTVVVDSNVFISALLGSPTAKTIINAFIEEKFEIIMSEELLEELAFAVRKPHLISRIGADDAILLLALLKERTKFIRSSIRLNVCRDEDDNLLLELALESGANLILSGDKDLLVLSPFRGVEVLSPSSFLKLLKTKRFI